MGNLNPLDEALIVESQALALSTPGARTLRDFRRSFCPMGVPTLLGRDESLFTSEKDLVALAPVDTDRLNVFLKKYFGSLFKVCSPWLQKRTILTLAQERSNIRAVDVEGLYYFPERRVQYAGAIITTILSALLLVGAIVCLLFVSKKSIGLRVGMIVLFTCLFAGVVGLLTNARRAEIFVSTAAYAAVLVVFISNINAPFDHQIST